jgi:hypothetical protein
MSTPIFDTSHLQELAERLEVRLEHLETIRQGGLYDLEEGEEYPPLYLEPWPGAELWREGIISQEEARYLDGLRIKRSQDTVAGWCRGFEAGEVPPELQGELEWGRDGGALTTLGTICSRLEAHTEQARTFVVEILERLSLEVQQVSAQAVGSPSALVSLPRRSA